MCSFRRLIRVTAIVLAFIQTVRARAQGDSQRGVEVMSHLDQAKLLWLKDAQCDLTHEGKFPVWKRQLDLFIDNNGLWRCGGRMWAFSTQSVCTTTNTASQTSPYHIATCYRCSQTCYAYNGVKETLTQTRMCCQLHLSFNSF